MTWEQDAQMYVAALAATGNQFTCDEVWHMLAKHSKEDPPASARAMGAVMKHMGSNIHVISPLAAYQTSSRDPDRALRLFMGTGHEHPQHKVTEKQTLWALQAIEAVARQRSQLMVAKLRTAAGVSSE